MLSEKRLFGGQEMLLQGDGASIEARGTSRSYACRMTEVGIEGGTRAGVFHLGICKGAFVARVVARREVPERGVLSLILGPQESP